MSEQTSPLSNSGRTASESTPAQQSATEELLRQLAEIERQRREAEMMLAEQLRA